MISLTLSHQQKAYRIRALDNIFVERLWRSVKYERVYLKAYDGVSAARADIADYLGWYNTLEILESIQARLAAIVRTADKHPPQGYFQIITPDAQSLPIPDLATAEGQAALAPRIADAELIVVDNLSCLMRTGDENKAEGWHSTAEWALDTTTDFHILSKGTI